MDYKDKKIAIVGFGVEGKDTALFLQKQGASFAIFDKKKKNKLDLSGIKESRITFFCGADYDLGKLKDFEVVVRSPGVYRFLPEIVEAEQKGVKITSAIKIFFENSPAKIIGVTGTKGKGTTSLLVYTMLKKAGKNVYLGGNIGVSLLSLLPRIEKNDWVVLELSSFQLIDLEKSPHIAVVLNITQDHLDWHKDIIEYINAKKNIVLHQNKTDFAVLNYDYKTSRSFAKITKARVLFFSKKQPLNEGSFIQRGYIYLSKDKKLAGVKSIRLRGEHNLENVLAAVTTAYIAGCPFQSIKAGLLKFRGYEHRLEYLGSVETISFYNDSAATIPQATIAAIDSFSEPLTVIIGGSDKGLDYAPLVHAIKDKENIVSVILIGKTGERIFDLIKQTNFQGKIVCLGKTSIDRIVQTAYKMTPRRGVVLFSPASASFDMFENYKERGLLFKKAVYALKEKFNPK